MFVTPSDLVRRLNESLSEQLGATTTTTTSDSGPSNNNSKSPKLFELHKRLPDGSAVPVNAADLQSLDFQAKLEQAASHVACLKTLDEKLEWAERQRQSGNELYHQGEYNAAMDVYLTCLTVVNPTLQQPQQPQKEEDSDEIRQQQQQRLLYVQVLNNLALCTLQLEWYHKTIQFCTMGLQQTPAPAQVEEQQSSCLPAGLDPNKNGTSQEIITIPDDDDDIIVESSSSFRLLDTQNSKLHYVRAKAYRLRGDYDSAVLDLDASEQWLRRVSQFGRPCGNHPTDTTSSIPTNNSTDIEVLQQNIQQERRRLQRAQVQAQRHAQQQKQALQQLWTTTTTTTTHSNPEKDKTTQLSLTSDNSGPAASLGVPFPPKKPLPGPLLYQDKDDGTQSMPRPYSTLRAPTSEPDNYDNDDDDSRTVSTFSYYWQWYLERLGRGAQRLLDWLDQPPSTGTFSEPPRNKQD